MLTALRLRNFAIVDELELEFGAGLTAITGETGAGKSVLIDALGLILGGRGSERAIRGGAECAEIEARFDEVSHPAVLAALDERGLGLDGGALIVRRVIARNASQRRVYIANRLATQADLRAIVAPLVDLSSQHAHHGLLQRRNHLDVVDRFAGLTAEREAFSAAWHGWRTDSDRLAALEGARRERTERRDWLGFVARELREAQLVAGEARDLTAELRKAQAAEDLIRACLSASAALADDDGVGDRLGATVSSLSRLERFDSDLVPLVGRARDLQAWSCELAADLSRYAESLDLDQGRQQEISKRLGDLHDLLRKYGGSEEAALERLAEVEAELGRGDADDRELELLQNELPSQTADLHARGEVLHQGRVAAVGRLGTEVDVILHALGMTGASFATDISRRGGDPGPAGLDNARFLLAANTGESRAPLEEVASGGELSRVLLAIKRASVDIDPVPTCLYDEVDAGLSGSVGSVLGRYLAELGRRQQVIVISHLPQVAAAADRHLSVSKEHRDGRTISQVTELDAGGRIDELARMLGAADGSDGEAAATARAHARALLDGGAWTADGGQAGAPPRPPKRPGFGAS